MTLPMLKGSKRQMSYAEEIRTLILDLCPDAEWLISQTDNALLFPYRTNIADTMKLCPGVVISFVARNIGITTFKLEEGTFTMRRKWTSSGKIILSVHPTKEDSIIMLLYHLLSKEDIGFSFDSPGLDNIFKRKKFPWYAGSVTVFPKNQKSAVVFSLLQKS